MVLQQSGSVGLWRRSLRFRECGSLSPGPAMYSLPRARPHRAPVSWIGNERQSVTSANCLVGADWHYSADGTLIRRDDDAELWPLCCLRISCYYSTLVIIAHWLFPKDRSLYVVPHNTHIVRHDQSDAKSETLSIFSLQARKIGVVHGAHCTVHFRSLI